ncbi:MAG: hypothetical protein AAF696_38555, partial [Bacteroidota bacterium]
FTLSISNGAYEYGKLVYNYHKVLDNGGKIRILLQAKKPSTFEKTFTLKLPRLDSIRLSYEEGKQSPKTPIPIDLHLYYEDGSSSSLKYPWETEGNKPSNHLDWKDFKIMLDDHAEISWGDHIKVNGNRQQSQAQLFIIPKIGRHAKIKLSVYSLHSPSLNTELEIPILYNAPQHFDFNASSKGENAETVNIFFKTIFIEKQELIWVQASQSGRVEETLLNPRIAKLKISCKGGQGKAGINGSQGINGDPNHNREGGSGSDGSEGGDGGNGANVYIYVDKASENWLDVIEIDNRGGAGGLGGLGGATGINPSKWATAGQNGKNGRSGLQGKAPQIIIVPRESLEAIQIPIKN